MADKPPPISHNRADYSPKAHLMAQAIADVFHNGDLDRVWEDFFRTMEEQRQRWDVEPGSVPTEARLILPVIPPSQ